MNKSIGIAVLGLGWMGQAHSRSALRIPSLFPDRSFDPRLVVCADTDASRMERSVRDFGFERAVADWREAVDAPDVDAVWVTAPNMLHVPMIEAACAAGKAVFSEKPIGGKPEQAVQAYRAAQAAGVATGVGYNYLWAPLVLHARELIASGQLGEITHYRGRFLSMYGSDELGLLSWRFMLDEAGYGVTSDILSHSVSMAQFLVGPIGEVVGMKATTITHRPLPTGAASHYGRGNPDDPKGEVENEDFASMLCRFASGATGTFEASRTMVGPESQNAFEVYGTKGALAWNLERINELQYYRLTDDKSSGYTTIFGGDRFPFHGAFVPGQANAIGFEDLVAIEDYSFLEALATGGRYSPGFREAVDVVSVQQALIDSWDSRGWQQVRDLAGDGVLMGTVRITTAEAIVRYLIAQRIVVDGVEVPLFPGAIGIFGHGNVLALGHSLETHRDELPVWRGQNEQGMGLAAAAFAKAMRRQQILVCTSSIGPGATNMVTAAGVAMSNRLPVLFISGDSFHSRLPDPVLQQVEHFGVPSTTVNDAFRPVVRYWDRITHPAQVIASLPNAVETMLDPAECGPAFIGLPQDVAAEAYDFPEVLFERQVREIARPRPDLAQVRRAVDAIRSARRPAIIAGGGVHYSRAEAELAAFAEEFGIPVVETVAGKSSLLADHPRYAGPVGVTGADAANAVVGEADVIVCVGTRLEDFTTGSWTAFAVDATLVGVNAARFDATKHRSIAVVGDARESLAELASGLQGWQSDPAWTDRGTQLRAELQRFVNGRTADDGHWPPSYAQLVGLVHDSATADDYVVAAAGGLPGELNVNWMSKAIASFDCEYGFSCMGYEISGAWGASLARPSGEVFAMVGDGSYLMLNSDIYAAVLSGRKFILVVCDNEGYAVIERLQTGQGGASYNNMLRDATGTGSHHRVDFRAHAEAMGAIALQANSRSEFVDALAQARAADRTTVIVARVREADWTDGGAFWQVGVPEVSSRPAVVEARHRLEAGLTAQRRGV